MDDSKKNMRNWPKVGIPGLQESEASPQKIILFLEYRLNIYDVCVKYCDRHFACIKSKQPYA